MPTKDDIRTIGLIIKQQTAAIAADVMPLYETSQAWVLNDDDDALPTDEALYAAVTDYEAIEKPVIGIGDALMRIKDVTLTDDEEGETNWPTLDARITALESAPVIDMSEITTKLNALLNSSQVAASSVRYRVNPVNNTRVIIEQGGYLWIDEAKRTIDADIELSCIGSLTVSAAFSSSTFLYIWGGVDANDDIKFRLSPSGSEKPIELVSAVLLHGGIRINAGGTVTPFEILGNYYRYTSPVNLDGSDETQIFRGASPTTNTLYSCSGYVPARTRVSLTLTTNNTQAQFYFNDHLSMLSGLWINYKLYATLTIDIPSEGVWREGNGEITGSIIGYWL